MPEANFYVHASIPSDIALVISSYTQKGKVTGTGFPQLAMVRLTQQKYEAAPKEPCSKAAQANFEIKEKII